MLLDWITTALSAAFYCILNVELMSVVKPKKQSVGGHRVIDDDSDDDDTTMADEV